jgi:hypothetical protein
MSRNGLDSTGSDWGPVVDFCKRCSEGLVPIKGEEFIDQLNYYHLLNKDSVPWSYLIHTST